MKTIFLFLLSATFYTTYAQVSKTNKDKSLTFCEALTKMRDAGESNFIGFTKADYVEGKSDYDAKWPLPGFDKNEVAVNTMLKMYYTSGNKYYKTIDEAKTAFGKVKENISQCFANKGIEAKTAKQPELNKWVSEHKDVLNNPYKIETTLAVFQNTKTGDWALEYFMMRK